MKSFFAEARWFTNNAIAEGIFDVSYKAKKVQAKVGEGFKGRNLNSGIDNDAKGHRDAMALGTALMPVDDETTTVMLEEYSARDCEPRR